MIKSKSLQAAKSIEDVVKIINSGGTSSFSSDEIAAQYIVDASEEYGIDSWDYHADCLKGNGADFDYHEVMRLCVNIIESI